MSLFQCDECGCVENTALGWYWSKDNPRLTKDEFLGKALCSSCGPTEYPSGEKTKMGQWHGKFKRVFLPKGEWETCDEGNLINVKTGDRNYMNFVSDVEITS